MPNTKKDILAHRTQYQKEESAAIVKLQAECPHLNIGHYDGFGDFGTVTNPQRVCFDCGLTETGGWWCHSLTCSHWHEDGKSGSKLGPREGRIFNKVESHEIHIHGLGEARQC